jgi:TolA-binding protein
MPASLIARTLAAAGCVLMCTGCVNSMGGTSLQGDMDDLRLSVDRLRQEQVETRSQVDALGAPTGDDEDLRSLVYDIRDRMDILGAQVQAVVRHLDDNDEDLAGLRYDLLRLDRMVEDLRAMAAAPVQEPGAEAESDDSLAGVATAGAAAAGGAAAASDLPPERAPTITSQDDPAGIFQRAYADYARGDYALAGMGFRTTLARDVQGPLADDSIYYLAEIAAAEGDTQGAMKGYSRVVDEFPDADKAPAALLKHGMLLIDANRIGEGVVQLDHLVKTYPQSEEARLARNKLRALGVGF